MKISGLPAAVGVTTDDLVPIVDAPGTVPVTKKATVAQLRAAIVPIALATDVSGTLPKGNQAPQDMSGDVTGSTGAAVVSMVKGTSIGTAGGALAIGTPLCATGVAAADWAPLNLASSNARTGILPFNNGGTGLSALGTGMQYLRTNAGGVAMEWATLSIAPGGSDGEIQTKSGSVFAGATNVKAGSGFLSLGATVPGTGDIRVRDGFTMNAIGANASTYQVLAWTSYSVSLGEAAAAVLCDQNGVVYLKAGSANRMYVTSTLIGTGLPRVGDSSPYASEGRSTQAMADANQTAAAAVYSRHIINCTGALTANRTLTLPHPASEDASYTKKIQLSATGGFGIVVSTGTGTTVTLASGAGNIVEIVCTPSGVATA